MTTKWLRYNDLRALNVVTSWTQLKRLVELHGFPTGRMLSPNVRAWTEDEINAYCGSRPVEGPEPRGAAKQRRDRRKAADSTTSTAA
jgi:hypothetical protein